MIALLETGPKRKLLTIRPVTAPIEAERRATASTPEAQPWEADCLSASVNMQDCREVRAADGRAVEGIDADFLSAIGHAGEIEFGEIGARFGPLLQHLHLEGFGPGIETSPDLVGSRGRIGACLSEWTQGQQQRQAKTSDDSQARQLLQTSGEGAR